MRLRSGSCFWVCLLVGMALTRCGICHAAVNKCGFISANETWTIGNSPYIICGTGLTIGTTATLTIQSGVVVKFQPGAYMVVNGDINAAGSASSKIVFTSIRDDSAGGDTNGDGSATTAAAGDWKHIWIGGTGSSAYLRNCELRYCGSTTWPSAGLGATAKCALDIDDCAIIHSAAAGINADDCSSVVISDTSTEDCAGLGVIVSNTPTPSINRCTVEGNGGAVRLTSCLSATVNGCTIKSKSGDGLLMQSCSGPTVTSNTITNTGGTKAGNAVQVTGTGSGDVTFSGIVPSGYAINGMLISSYQISATSRWRFASDVACVLWDVRVLAGVTLTIDPGAVIKLKSGGTLIANGVLIAGLAGGAKTYFTSLSDDTVGGDTNSDASATSPARGDWKHLWAGGSGSELRLANCDVRYGGATSSPYAATAATSSGKLYATDCLVWNSLKSGAYSFDASVVQLTGTTFDSCGSNGIEIRSTPVSALRILDCVSKNNTGCGMYVDGSPQCRVERATVSGNAGDGVAMVSCASPVLTSSTFTGNGGAAVSLTGNIIGDIGNTSNSASGNQTNGLLVPSGVCGATRWMACSTLPYVLSGPLTIPTGSSLTLDPGLIMKLHSSSRITCGGTLTAIGTASSPIAITSIKDDTIGGDTNNDGGLSGPARGDWRHICITGTGARGTLSNCIVRYGGLEEWPQGIISCANSGTLSIDQCTLSYSAGPGVHIDGGATDAVTVSRTGVSACATQGIQILNCTRPLVDSCDVRGNSGIGIKISACPSPRLINNTISSNGGGAASITLVNGDLDCSGNNGAGNAVNAIALLTNSSDFAVSTSTTWHANPTLPYAPVTHVVQSAGTTWTLDAGVIIKPPVGAYRILCNGRLIVNGTAAQPVCITSYRDDEIGGDTNGDLSGSLPAAGNWKHLRISGASASATLNNLKVFYGGHLYATSDFPQGAIGCTDGGTMTLSGCIVAQSTSCGILADGVAGLRIEQTSTDSCAMDGIRAASCPNMLISGCTLANGTGDGAAIKNCAAPNISNSTASACANGFALTDCSNVLVSAATASANRAWGISAGNSAGISISSSTVATNGAGGLTVTNAETCTLVANTFTGNTGYAAILTGNLGVTNCAGNSASGNVVNGIVLKQASLSGSSRWQTNTVCPYVVTGGLTVNAGAELALDPGVVVKLANPGGSISCQGEIVAEGDDTSHITFTSLKDDSIAGDSNGDLLGSAPAPGDWNHIWVNGGEACGTFENCDVRYGGSYAGPAELPEANLACSDAGTIAITACQLSDSLNYGLYVSGHAGLVLSGITVTRCGRYGMQLTQCPEASVNGCSLIANTSIGLNMCACPSAVISGNTFRGNSTAAVAMSDDIGDVICSGNSAEGNGANGLLLSGAIIDGASRWRLNPGFPYVINGTLTITENGNLTVDPGVAVKLDAGSHRIDCSGVINATGTSESTIYFTSIHDDSVGGDTSSDADAFAAASGDWNHILLQGSRARGTFERCIIRYGGGYRDASDLPQANLACWNQASVTVSNSDIARSSNLGIFAEGANTTIKNTIIAYNDACGVYLTGGACYLSYCDLWENPYNYMDDFIEITCTIQGDPAFGGLASGDYRLSDTSACIDKGDPAVTDSDGSRLDIGALPFGTTVIPWQDIASAKGCLDGAEVGLPSVIVTMGTESFPGICYVENEDRTSGIRVTTDQQVPRGKRVSVRGVMATTGGERRIEAESIVQIEAAPVPAPLLMANKLLGGGDGPVDPAVGKCQTGVTGGTGLNNIGLLVSTCGAVTFVNAQTILIDDGCQTPVKCVAPPLMQFDSGLAYVRVTGVSSCEISDGRVKRVLLLRDAADLRSL